jgi:hypothetical protein
VKHPDPIAERLRAFAKLYEHMAEHTWSEEQALQLLDTAKRCLAGAAECERDKAVRRQQRVL